MEGRVGVSLLQVLIWEEKTPGMMTNDGNYDIRKFLFSAQLQQQTDLLGKISNFRWRCYVCTTIIRMDGYIMCIHKNKSFYSYLNSNVHISNSICFCLFCYDDLIIFTTKMYHIKFIDSIFVLFLWKEYEKKHMFFIPNLFM